MMGKTITVTVYNALGLRNHGITYEQVVSVKVAIRRMCTAIAYAAEGTPFPYRWEGGK